MNWDERVQEAAANAAPRPRLVTVSPTDDPEVRRADKQRAWEATVGPRLAGATVDSLTGDLRRWVDEWLASDTADLVFAGPVGCGKTWAATAAVHTRHMELPYWQDAMWTTVPQLMEDLRPDGNRQWALGQAQSTPVLMLDDLGRDKPTDWTLEQLHLILDHRHRHMLPTVATTNYSPTDLPGRIGRQAASRLLGGDCIGGVPADSSDRRQT